MKHSKRIRELSKKLKVKRKMMALCCIAVIAVAGIAYELSVVYGKYYATQYNKGIAIASDLYFNSDKLSKIDKLMESNSSTKSWKTDIDWVETNLVNNNKVPLISNTTQRWSSGALDLYFRIQNYDSNILFNSSELTVGYNVEFKLLDEGKNATYWISDDNGASYMQLKYGETFEAISGSLKGGTLNSKEYRIRVVLDDAHIEDIRKDYEQARVLVMAYPTDPSYLVKETDQPFLLVGMFAGRASDMKMTIASQEFKSPVENTTFSSNYKKYIENLSGLIYNIKTEGDIVNSDSVKATKEITVAWRNDLVEISQYDEYYEKYGSEITTDANAPNYSFMKIKALPYTSINITFYKKAGFKVDSLTDDMFDITDNLDDLKNNLVYAYIEETE